MEIYGCTWVHGYIQRCSHILEINEDLHIMQEPVELTNWARRVKMWSSSHMQEQLA